MPVMCDPNDVKACEKCGRVKRTSQFYGPQEPMCMSCCRGRSEPFKSYKECSPQERQPRILAVQFRKARIPKEQRPKIVKSIETEKTCELCGEEVKQNQRLSIDADGHGGFHGLLCKKCRLGLTHFGRNPKLLTKAISYLEART
jgi:hypothetical protein